MAASDDFSIAVEALGKVGNLWDSFAIVHSKGFDGRPIFAAILPKVIGLGCGLLVVMFLLRIMDTLSKQIDDPDERLNLLGLATEVVLVAVFIVAYDPLVLLLPHLFDSLGRSMSRIYAPDLGAQIAGALEILGNEKTSEFRFLTAMADSSTVMSFLSAIFTFIALILMWVLGKFQAYLFTFWYLLGPLALPTLIFPPMRRIGTVWFSSLMGTAFMSITGSLIFYILVRAAWLPKAFAAGVQSDYATCLAFSLICVVSLLTIPAISFQLWSGIEIGVRSAVSGAKKAMSRGVGVATKSAAAIKAVTPSTPPRPPVAQPANPN